MNKNLLITIFYFISVLAFSQKADTLDIISCFNQFKKKYPIVTDKQLYQTVSLLRLKNQNVNWYPSVNFSGQATYQSDVVQLALDPNNPMFKNISMPTAPHDQYKFNIDISQTLYDGGMIKSLKQLERNDLLVSTQQVEVEICRLKNQVSRFYFMVLIFIENEKMINQLLNELGEREKTIKSSLKNGIVLQSDLDIIKAEILKTEQRKQEINLDKISCIRALEVLADTLISDNCVFTLPTSLVNYSDANVRPELTLFDYQLSKMDASIKVSNTIRMPKLYAFGQLGYGKPGLNMLNNKWDSYYLIGANLKWNLWDWQTNSRNKQIITIQKKLIDSRKEEFTKNVSIELDNKLAEIKKYELLLQKDEDLVKIRENISKNALSQYQNGVITATDYLSLLNAENNAKINYAVHTIQFEQSKITYLLTKGIY